MCLSSVYEISDGRENLLCDHVTSIDLNNGAITLTDIMGEEIVIRGVLKNIDLVKNTVKIET